jgi:hypothetical protein
MGPPGACPRTRHAAHLAPRRPASHAAAGRRRFTTRIFSLGLRHAVDLDRATNEAHDGRHKGRRAEYQ